MAGIKTQDREALEIYFQDIAASKPLSVEEEFRLAQQIRNGSREARNTLVAANLKFVVRMAFEYQGQGVALEDLISAGNVGLIVAAERFDETRGFKFITYATWWIRQAICRSLSQDSRMVRLPDNRVKLLHRISNRLRRLGQTQEAEPELKSIAKGLGVSVEMVRDTLALAQHARSLDAPFQNDNKHNPLNALSDDTQEAPDTQVIEDSDRKQIEMVLDTLEKREALVLRLYFGLGKEEALTLEKTGSRLGLTKERVRQIKEKALRKLRHPWRRSKLDPLRDST